MQRLPIRTEPEVAAFLRAIKETPDDDTPRLIFADWLEDHDLHLNREFASDGRDHPHPSLAAVAQEQRLDW